jgi:hypothetical protein
MKTGVISLCIALTVLGIVIWSSISIDRNAKRIRDDSCQAYCNCSISHNCDYVFPYDEFKDCNCSK